MNVNEIELDQMGRRYDVVVIGTGFGSLFFLHKFLQRSRADLRVLLLECGGVLSHADQLARNANSERPPDDYISVPAGHKPWNFTIGLGGGTLCWWGQAPRMHPSDFALRSKYGRGQDWPLSYSDLEPYYAEAEHLIGIAGDSERVGPYWRSRPYPMPAHIPSSADERMRALYPDQLALPCARASVPNAVRPQCCSVGDCRLCPNDAKFTAHNGLAHLWDDARVSIVLGADVKAFETSAGHVTAAIFSRGGRLHRARGDLFVLGANGIFNPAILARSGITHRNLGRGINEQLGVNVEVKLQSLSGLNGGTSGTGMYCGYADGDHRRDVGASIVFFDNRFKFFGLRRNVSKLLNKIELHINSEDLSQQENFVEIPGDWDSLPVVHHARTSDYGERGIAFAYDRLDALLAPLNVEGISRPRRRPTESHLLGTTRMGDDPDTAIVDGRMIHHQYRNLTVVGSSVFPTCPVANPSLTAAALSLRAADRVSS